MRVLDRSDYELSLTIAQSLLALYNHNSIEIEKSLQANNVFVNDLSNVRGKSIFSKLKTFVKDPIIDLQFYLSIVLERDEIYIGFQGSKEFSDWFTNLSIRKFKHEVSEYNAHYGYVKTVEVFENWFKNYCSEKKYDFFDKRFENIKIILSGHSMGGGLASIAALRLIKLGAKPENINVYMYGAPPVFTKVYSEIFDPNIKIYRFVNEKDFVPKVSSIMRLLGGREFYHAGEEIKLPSNEDEMHSLLGYIDNLAELIKT